MSDPLPNPLQRTLARWGLPTKDFAAMAGPLGVTPKETIHAQGTLKLPHFEDKEFKHPFSNPCPPQHGT